MTSGAWPVYSPFAREHYGRGVKKGIQDLGPTMLLRVLAARGIDVPEDVRARISACSDPEQFACWNERAVSIQSARELFDEPDERTSSA
jgi:hypothetical protein